MYKKFLKIPYEAPSSAIFGSAETEPMVKNIDKAIANIEKIEVNEAKALAAAGRITVWTKPRSLFVVNVVAIIGLIVYDKVKERKINEELEKTLKRVCTARLYARYAERMELTHTDQMSSLKRLAKDYANGKTDRIADDLADTAEQASESLKAIT
ncbi:hypothetical protein ColTof4_01409 [Colletotrichum tofieldiae]|uniref:Uncharacterized protein n=1 Tax=Colletotrichum tofieldiae TaxID=708197 RepID=A0A166NIG7_9PEZI|nr:hypothetical protein CT0861_02671 [Colletotrichum tofieldiae]GKT61327.1 hypothetical protein ColTof3_08666 [Colletotrichum tofieldiae]GKT68986.1 hypothetical protein ColTof4_01409 [Colletotrichum tofieldiae]GKT96850.1 hypothetical protein Ct61P_14700 [Colletotrichum tofieldiae]